MAKPNDPSANVENPLSAGANEAMHRDGSSTPWWRRLLQPNWIAAFVALSLLLPGVVYAYSRLASQSPVDEAGQGEVSLGSFRFLANVNERSPITAATFSLHLALIPETDALARSRLASHKHRVQQDIEQLLRQAHGGDFEDPSLGDLKRQLQEQINETLGIRAVADVVVTDLGLELSGQHVASPHSSAAAGAPSWSNPMLSPE